MKQATAARELDADPRRRMHLAADEAPPDLSTCMYCSDPTYLGTVLRECAGPFDCKTLLVDGMEMEHVMMLRCSVLHTPACGAKLRADLDRSEENADVVNASMIHPARHAPGP